MTAILTAAERATLAATLNILIPARANLPGAGDLGVAVAIEREMEQAPPLRRALLDALRAIEFASGEPGFLARTPDEQEALLHTVEAAEPASFALLVEHAYRGYYVLPAVQRALGLSGEPPQPQGYQLAPFDPALLAKQRQREPFWRRIDGEEQ
jgi:hypothetical protein